MQAGSTIYGYDENGSRISKDDGTTQTTYTYDSRNRLIQATTTSGGMTTKTLSYAYDNEGNRIEKTEDGVTTKYLVDRNQQYAQVLKALDSSNATITDYLYGLDLIKQSRSATDHYYLTDDGLGSTKALTDSLGNITDTYDYSAYGELIDRTGTTANDYLFTGEQYDPALNQYYLRARYYDQNIGRFTQQDTWDGEQFSPITLNKHIYANSDPINWVDPSGNIGLSSIGAALRVNGILATRAGASAVGRSLLENILIGNVSKRAFGIVGEEIIALARESLLNILIAEAGGKVFPSAGAKGIAAHREFERLIKGLNSKYKKFGLRIVAEVFRDGGGGRKVRRRFSGSVGIDVAILSTRTGKTLLAFDLKTGKRGSSRARNRKLKAIFDGADIIEIFVSKK